MKPERLDHIIRTCANRMSEIPLELHQQHIAEFLRVEPRTLRRWLSGATPIPWPIEILFELFYARRDINAAMIRRIIDQRDSAPDRT